MSYTIEFRDRNACYIKQWPNWDGIVPMVGDTVVLHYGDNNEREEYCEVQGREISGTQSDKVVIYLNTVI